MSGEQRVVDVGRGIELCYDQIGDPDRPADRADRRSGPAVAHRGRPISPPRWPGAAIGSSGSTTATSAGRPIWTFRRRTRLPSSAAATTAAVPPRRHGARHRRTCSTRSGIADAHLVGISMGGMIAQTVAAHYPGRVRTLTSIMSTTGAPRIGRPALSTWWRMATATAAYPRRGDGRRV